MVPVLSDEEIYQHGLPLIYRLADLREPQWFSTKADGDRWLTQHETIGHDHEGKPILGYRNDCTWLQYPVPRRDLSSFTGPSLVAGQFLRDHLKPEDFSARPAIHSVIRWPQIVQQRALTVQCVLGDDWEFGPIASTVRASRAYEFMGRKVDGFAQPIIDVLRELESVLIEKYPNISVEAAIAFWHSWQVYLFLAGFGSGAVLDSGLRELAGESGPVSCFEQASYVVKKEIAIYTRSLAAAADKPAGAPAMDRESRICAFKQGHATTFADITRSAHVNTRDMARWRKNELKDTSVMSQRIEKVLSGEWELKRSTNQ